MNTDSKTRKRIERLLRGGKSILATSKLVGVSRIIVSDIAKELGLSKQQKQAARDALIVDAYKRGDKIKDIESSLGVSCSVINSTLKRAGVSERRNKPLPEDAKRKMAEAYARGDKVAAIAAEFGVCDTVPMRCALELGYEKRRPNHKIKPNAAELDVVSAYVCTKKTLAEIASEFEVSQSYVSDTLKRNCIDRDRKFKRYASISILE